MNRRRLLLVTALPLTILAVPWLLARPSNERDWQPNQAVLPWADVAGDSVRVHNVRNTRTSRCGFGRDCPGGLVPGQTDAELEQRQAHVAHDGRG
ncbi:MAG: hypothetical protein ACREL9_12180 [Gemmatimonadales bacterium]